MQGLNNIYDKVQQVAMICLEMKVLQSQQSGTQQQIYQQGDAACRKIDALSGDVRYCKRNIESIKDTYLKYHKSIDKLRDQANIVQKLKQEVEKMNVSTGNYEDDTKGQMMDIFDMKYEESFEKQDSFNHDVSFDSFNEVHQGHHRTNEKEIMSGYIETVQDMCAKLETLIQQHTGHHEVQNVDENVIEEVLLKLLDNKKFHDKIKFALAEKLTDWLKQPLLLTNIRKSMKEAFVEEDYKLMLKALMHEVANEAHEGWRKTSMEQANKVIDNCHDQQLQLEKFVVQELQLPKQQMEFVRDDLTKKMNLMSKEHKKHHDETSCEFAILRQEVKVNAGKLDIGLANNHKFLKETTSDLAFKINSGQDEILSNVKDLSTFMSEDKTHNGKNTDSEIALIKESVSGLQDVMHSFDKHLTDIKGEVVVVHELYHTMIEIVRALNATFGEEVVQEPPEPGDTQESANEAENPEKPAKQRAARRTKKLT
jgi:hypothetical protein